MSIEFVIAVHRARVQTVTDMYVAGRGLADSPSVQHLALLVDQFERTHHRRETYLAQYAQEKMERTQVPMVLHDLEGAIRSAETDLVSLAAEFEHELAAELAPQVD